MAEDLSKNILDKIKQQDVKPRSKFSFLAKNYAFWISAGISVLVGALTVATILFVLFNQDFTLFTKSYGNSLKFFLVALPYFWFIIFSLFIWIAYYNVKHIDRGYKLTMPIIIGVYFVGTIVLGSMLYRVGIGKYTEEVFVHHVPFYGHMVERRHMLWNVPEQGLLMGRVLEIDPEHEILLLDIAEQKWNVDISEATYPMHLQIKKEMILKIWGSDRGDYQFYARELRPHMLPMKGIMFQKR